MGKRLAALLVIVLMLSACQTTPEAPPEGPAENARLTLTFPFGQRSGDYSGQTQDGLPHGEGVFVTDAWTYTGGWQAGLFHGYGQLVYPDGLIKQGQHQDGVLVDGVMIENDKTIFEGAFNSDGKPLSGTVYDNFGNIDFQGQLDNGRYVETEAEAEARLQAQREDCQSLPYYDLVRQYEALSGTRVYYYCFVREIIPVTGSYVNIIATGPYHDDGVENDPDRDEILGRSICLIHEMAAGEQFYPGQKIIAYGVFLDMYRDAEGKLSLTLPVIQTHYGIEPA